jgi:hypothetical protein
MTVKELLTSARDLIAEPEHWTQSDYAKNKDGERCSAFSEHVFSFCALGALFRVGDDAPVLVNEQARLLLAANMRQDIAGFNDMSTHQEVIAAFDAAIAEAQS